MDGRDGTPDRRVGRPPAHGSLRMGPSANVPARDRDHVYGQAFIGRMRAMGIRDQPTSPRSPWQNAYAERLIGSIRRECVDHIVVFGERHLRHALLSYMNYYNEARTHLSLGKDAPVSRVVHAVGQILRRPILGGLHHRVRPNLICGRHRRLTATFHTVVQTPVLAHRVYASATPLGADHPFAGWNSVTCLPAGVAWEERARPMC